jgi:predicted permease
MLASVDLGLQGYPEVKGRTFFKQILERIKAIPGVEAASMGGPLPLDAYSNGARLNVEGYVPRYENERIGVNYSTVGYDYFEAMNTPIVEGRGFTEHDDQNAPRVVVVNETLADRFWPGQSAIGKRLQLGGGRNPFLVVVGVAKDGKYVLMGEPPTEYLFIPQFQNYDPKMTLIARTTGDPARVAEAMRQEVAMIDPELPVYGIKTVTVFLDRILAGPKSLTAFAMIFGLVALLMATIGLYGVVSYSVAQRSRELGIRIALGARSTDVLRLVLKEGAILAGAGIFLGLITAVAAAQLLVSFLYGVSSIDPVTFVAVPVALGLVCLLACYAPARRAARTDPMVSIRS